MLTYTPQNPRALIDHKCIILVPTCQDIITNYNKNLTNKNFNI